MMNEPQICEVIFPPAFLRNHMVHVKFLAIFQVLMADRTETALPLDKLSVTKRRPLRLRSSLLPVLL
jgi:hypothetical protein